MAESGKKNASIEGGASFTKLAGGVSDRIKTDSSAKHTADLRRELQRAGLGLHNAHGVTQRAMLLRVLQYLGGRGINTAEAVGCGYHRVATRIQELEADGWRIDRRAEPPVDVDGPSPVEMARYVLRLRTASTPMKRDEDAA